MNKTNFRIGILFVICAATATCFQQAAAEDNCDFDSSGIVLPRISKTSVKSTDWNKNRLEYRAILDDGSILFVKYWACDQWGLAAQVTKLNDTYADSDSDDDEELKNGVMTLAREVLDPKLATDVESALTKKKGLLKFNKNIDLPIKNVREFSIGIQSNDVFTTIYLSYYKD